MLLTQLNNFGNNYLESMLMNEKMGFRYDVAGLSLAYFIDVKVFPDRVENPTSKFSLYKNRCYSYH
jgi:hypothetical protein